MCHLNHEVYHTSIFAFSSLSAQTTEEPSDCCCVLGVVDPKEKERWEKLEGDLRTEIRDLKSDIGERDEELANKISLIKELEKTVELYERKEKLVAMCKLKLEQLTPNLGLQVHYYVFHKFPIFHLSCFNHLLTLFFFLSFALEFLLFLCVCVCVCVCVNLCFCWCWHVNR
jgi:hypothetical protein